MSDALTNPTRWEVSLGQTGTFLRVTSIRKSVPKYVKTVRLQTHGKETPYPLEKHP